MHTGGEPVRIVVKGYPKIEGNTILDKIAYVRDKFDHLRRVLMLEPRGFDGMYGVIPVETDVPEADMAVLFIHGEGETLGTEFNKSLCDLLVLVLQ